MSPWMWLATSPIRELHPRVEKEISTAAPIRSDLWFSTV
jgi:hypothetical protein